MKNPQQPWTVTTKRGANHGLHLVLTVFTCGMWAITGWPIAALMGRKTKTTTHATDAVQEQFPQQWHQPYPPQQAPHGQQFGPYGKP